MIYNKNVKHDKQMRKSLEILAPIACYWVITSLVILFSTSLLGVLQQGILQGQSPWILAHTSQLSVALNALAVVVSYPFTYAMFQRSIFAADFEDNAKRLTKQMKYLGPCCFLFGGFLAVGLNVGMSFIKSLQNVAEYEQVSNIQYSVSLPIGLLVFGILTPLGEELVFRGAVYNRLRRYFGAHISVVVSALMFGVYHGNLVQFIYAFLMGLAMGFLYERTRKILAPILFHCGANCVIYTLSKSAVLSEKLCTAPRMLVFFLLAFVLEEVIRRSTDRNHCEKTRHMS